MKKLLLILAMLLFTIELVSATPPLSDYNTSSCPGWASVELYKDNWSCIYPVAWNNPILVDNGLKSPLEGGTGIYGYCGWFSCPAKANVDRICYIVAQGSKYIKDGFNTASWTSSPCEGNYVYSWDSSQSKWILYDACNRNLWITNMKCVKPLPPISSENLPPTSKPLICSSNKRTANINELITFDATGGSGAYSWITTGNPPTGKGNSISVKYDSTDPKTKTVTLIASDGEQVSCFVDIISSNNESIPPPTSKPLITLASWRTGGENIYDGAQKATTDPIEMYGETSNIPNGANIKAGIKKVVGRDSNNNLILGDATLLEYNLIVDNNKVRKQFTQLMDIFGGNVNSILGEEFAFVLSYTGADPKSSHSIKVSDVTEGLTECRQANNDETKCNTLDVSLFGKATDSKCGTIGSDGKLICCACNYQPLDGSCNFNIYSGFSSNSCPSIEIQEQEKKSALCQITVDNSALCDSGWKNAKINRIFTSNGAIKPNGSPYTAEDLNCAPSVEDVRLPCDRSLAELPATGTWQLIGAVLIIGLIYIFFTKKKR